MSQCSYNVTVDPPNAVNYSDYYFYLLPIYIFLEQSLMMPLKELKLGATAHDGLNIFKTFLLGL